MDNVKYLSEENTSFTDNEKNAILNVLAKALFFQEEEKQHQKVDAQIEILNQTIAFLTKFYYSNLGFSKKDKSTLIQLIDKFTTRKELIEISKKNEDELEEFNKTIERFKIKMQSSAPLLFGEKLDMYLAGNLKNEEAIVFLNDLLNDDSMLSKVLRDKKYRKKINDFFNIEIDDKSPDRTRIFISINSEIQKLSKKVD